MVMSIAFLIHYVTKAAKRLICYTHTHTHTHTHNSLLVGISYKRLFSI